MKDIPGYKGLYAITRDGKIWSYKKRTQRGSFIRGRLSSPGYLSVGLRKNKVVYPFRIHRLVALTYIPNPQKKCCVNHKNGDKLDNRVKNLEWVTYSENGKHSWNILGNKTLGERSSGHKLTELQVKEIRHLRLGGATTIALGKQFGVSNSVISRIINRKTWKHI